MADVPKWSLKGHWFDVCSCNIACPCEFAQAPTNNHCEGVLAYHVTKGTFGDVKLDGLSVIAVAAFDGNLWAGEGKLSMGLFIDERSTEAQRNAIQAIFSGQAGGFMASLARSVGEVRGVEFVPISFELADDLAHWRAEIPGKVSAHAEALTGPTADPTKRVQLLNPPGSEVGPNQGVATWGKAKSNKVRAFGFEWNWAGQSSKHIPFDWSGPA
jgi:hypothetical protein